MNRLWLVALAGSAALAPFAASAQTVGDPDPAYGVPNVALQLPASASAASAAPGVTWTQSGATATSALPPPPPPTMGGGYRMGGRPPMMGHPPMMGGHPPMMGRPPMGGHGGHFGSWQRIGRGGHVPQRWWGPRFRIRNWGFYGFPQPFAGGQWIRYYDDALLIDRDGRVLDGRYGWDWDRYGERWDYDDDGVPAYADDDYDDRYDEWAGRDGYRREGPPPPCPSRCVPHSGPMYGYGRGYGYVSGPIVVTTTTTVTEAPVVETRTVYETVVERVRVAPRRVVRHRCVCRVAPPRPGERG